MWDTTVRACEKQVDMLRPGLLGSRDDYGRRYCGGFKKQIAPGVFEYRCAFTFSFSVCVNSRLLPFE